ncbi:MAG: LysM peptidoglycan-binding domain-containing protein [Pseudomonadota bacterium]
MRTKVALHERSRGPAACVAVAFALSACSADVTRFDFPAFSLGQSGTETAALPAPPEPIYQFKSPKETAKLPAYETAKPYRVAQADTSITRSNLGRPGDDYSVTDAAPGAYGVQPTSPRVRRSASPRPLQTGHGRKITVVKGDTLYGIARRTGVSVSAIKSANALAGNSIRIGQRLIIPGGRYDSFDEPRTTASTRPDVTLEERAVVRRAKPRRERAPRVTSRPAPISNGDTYRVQPGDSLYAIARATGHKANDIAAVNGITDPSIISVGQVLRLPAGGGTFAAAPSQTYKAQPRKTRRVASIDKSAGISNDSFAPIKPKARPVNTTSFRWPARGRIISRFGGKLASGNNDGINLAVPEGTSVKSVEDGVVAYAGSELKGYGKLLLIRHKDDWVSAYAHNSKLLVKRGDRIRRGQTIAKAGRTGSVDRPQVHFELRKGSKPVDPLKYLARN